MDAKVLMDNYGVIIAAIGALGTAASGLVDSTKLLPAFVNVSRRGQHVLNVALLPFAPALSSVLGTGWLEAIMGHWINGEPRIDQKNRAKSLIRLGLSSKNCSAIATAGHVDEGALKKAIDRLEQGQDLDTANINVLGRLDASVDAILDAAYEHADQQYRNMAKVLAGVVSVALAIAGNVSINGYDHWANNLGVAALVGVVAVPLAPVTKDLTTALQNAVKAMRAVTGKKS